MHPVRRTWVLNETNGAKLRRQGYTMLPDFAWTAFMAQGMSLNACVAECGDVLDTPGLSEQMSVYVILSRLRAAHGLLLLRAFSHELFANGKAPDPHCMLKFLRARFNREDASFTVQDARNEYDKRIESYKKRRETIQQRGPAWTCFDCKEKYPAEEYGAAHTNSDEVYQKCIALGHWLWCQDCQTHRKAYHDAWGGVYQRCACCKESRESYWFSEKKRY